VTPYFVGTYIGAHPRTFSKTTHDLLFRHAHDFSVGSQQNQVRVDVIKGFIAKVLAEAVMSGVVGHDPLGLGLDPSYLGRDT